MNLIWSPSQLSKQWPSIFRLNHHLEREYLQTHVGLLLWFTLFCMPCGHSQLFWLVAPSLLVMKPASHGLQWLRKLVFSRYVPVGHSAKTSQQGSEKLCTPYSVLQYFWNHVPHTSSSKTCTQCLRYHVLPSELWQKSGITLTMLRN